MDDVSRQVNRGGWVQTHNVRSVETFVDSAMNSRFMRSVREIKGVVPNVEL